MKKTFKQALLASAVIGLAGATMAQAGTKDGFYLTPNAEVIFVDKSFTKGNGTGVGGGGGLNLGYQIKNFQIELAVGYDYYGGKGTVTQQFAGAGAALNPILKGAGVAGLETTSESTEGFIPVTLGLNYVIPMGSTFSITPGIAGGMWYHTIDRKLSYNTADITKALGAAAGSFATLLGSLTSAPATDNASELKGIVVPSVSVDYSPSQNLTISLGGKFYIVPGGYSDAYNKDNQTAANATSALLEPAYTATEQNFWYGALNLGVRYTF